ncbi:AfsR/SARP family transcriptional regulator [Serinicoccus chungangensis]|uniref:AfsR/SARP family transcriptional regulator n=1 Tax=Serinicoccus chungangensis TaxID=767452 RepID=UPI00111B0AEC|nr:BTAD domain-containing putative transcriptional regulator [Serinicoccus chungangensis]
MPQLRFGVLGTLEVRVDGRPVHIPVGRRRAVLTCLLVHADAPVSTDALVEAAWGEEHPADPRGALQTVVSRLRTLLGPDAVQTVEDGYRLPAPPAQVDALELEDLVAQARAAEPAGASALLEQARALWRGPPFGALADRESVMAAAARLEGMRHEATELHAAALLDLGEEAAAVPLLTELLAEQPYREHAVGLLAQALYRLGRQADALDLLDRHRRRMADELGLDPSPDLVDLQTRVLGHALPTPATVRAATAGGPTDTRPADGREPDDQPGAGPVAVGPVAADWLRGAAPLTGREDDLARVLQSLGSAPLTIVTGPGGVGKTRLAAEAVRRLAGRSALPVVVTELAGVGPGDVASAVAGALRVGRRTPDPTEAVIDLLTMAPHVLVVDDAEHRLAEVGDLLARVTHRCGGTHVLVTSRKRLGVAAERVLPLSPLAVPGPEDGGGPEMSAAVRLFVDRVRRLRPGFGVNATNAAAVTELCRRLDGLPLALELAAARTATLGLEEVLALLPAPACADDGHLAPEDNPASGRPGTGRVTSHDDPAAPAIDALGLDPTVAWSYRLLDDAQQGLLARLSVFPGYFGAAAVRSVCAALDDGPDPGGALAELVEASLVTTRSEGPRARHRLLGVVREYAARRLVERGAEEVDAQRAHAAWAATESERVAEVWSTLDGTVVDARLGELVPDLIVALRRAVARVRATGSDADLLVALRAAGAVGRCLHWVPPPDLGDLHLAVAELAVSRWDPPDVAPEDAPAVANGVGAGAMVAVERGELDRARHLALAGHLLAGGTDEPLVCVVLGVEAMYRGEAAVCTEWFTRLGRLPGLAGESHTSRALMSLYAGDLAAAQEHVAVALTASGSGADASRAFALYAHGEVLAVSDAPAATARLREAAALSARIGAAQVSKVARLALFARLVRDGRREEARGLGGALLRDLQRTGSWAQIWTMLRVLTELLVAEGECSDAAFLLCAAEHDPSAPPLMGEDIARHATLWERLSDAVGESVLGQIQVMASSTPRSHIMRRALALLS